MVFTLISYRQKSNCIGCDGLMSHVKQMPSVCAFTPLCFLFTFMHWCRLIELEGNLGNICPKMAAMGALSLKMLRQEDEPDGKCRGNSNNGKVFRVY